MKQLQQVNFSKPPSNVEGSLNNVSSKQKSTAHSQIIRIIAALLIAILIYNSSQQTTINYNQIIKNQKMFLVKNIRGVIPTLSGDARKLNNIWRVVHFQNYHENDSEIFNNYTLKFNLSTLTVFNIYCNLSLLYNWKNYSYNIDFLAIQQSINSAVNISKANVQNIQNQEFSLQFSKKSADFRSLPQSQQLKQKRKNQNPLKSSILQNFTQLSRNGLEQIEKKAQCKSNINYMKEVMLFTSVWTISGQNLYLLMQKANQEQDFYMILKLQGR